MAYNAGFLRLSFLYNVSGSDEIGETALHLSSGPGGDLAAQFADWTPADLQDSGDDLYTQILSSGSLQWGDYSNLLSVKLSPVKTDGTLLQDPLVRTLTTPRSGSTSHVPVQCSVLLSLWSGHNTGNANYGRMYLPHTKCTQATNSPYIASVPKASMLVNFNLFITAIKARATGMAHPTTVSNVSKTGAGSTKEVAYVRMGQIIDTQRRRTNRLDAAYDISAV